MSVICLATGIYVLWLGKQMRTKIIDLVLHRPQYIAEAYHYRVQKNGVVAHGVHFKTTKDKKLGLDVPSEQRAYQLLGLLRKHAPHIEIK